jgi:hypothetical protein
MWPFYINGRNHYGHSLCNKRALIVLDEKLSYDHREVQCFRHKKFFSGSVKRNFLKGKTSCKGNVKIRFIFGSAFVF